MSSYRLKYKFHPEGFNPLFWHILAALHDESIRYIFIEGSASASKTFSICQALLVDSFHNEYSVMVFRRQLVDVIDSVYSTFKLTARGMEFDYYDFQQHLLKGKDDKAHIRFRGLEDEENIKGIERMNVVYFNEFNQIEEYLNDQAKLRLRGRRNQKFIYDWNPISAKLWQYENLIDPQQWIDLPLTIDGREYSELNAEFSFKRINETGDSLWIKTTYRDNYWIVGRPGGGGYIDQHVLDNFELMRVKKPNLYRIYANGERGITRTGGEFWKQFDEVRHIKPVSVEPTTIHITCDQNANPYVTVLAWQIVDKNLRQINEFLCRNPDNNAVKSAQKIIKWLREINYRDVLFIYGDPSGNSANVIDENNRSFYDKFISTIEAAGFSVHRRIGRSHPEVARSAEFINDIYENNYGGYSITISDNCTGSIDDYISVKEDKDGKMLKTKIKNKETGQTYEPNGHASDAKRYFITQILKEEFEQYMNRSNLSTGYVGRDVNTSTFTRRPLPGMRR